MKFFFSYILKDRNSSFTIDSEPYTLECARMGTDYGISLLCCVSRLCSCESTDVGPANFKRG